MTYRPEPEYTHGTEARTAILLINLGTPDAPSPTAVRRYLKQFLSDPRVVEIPRALWWLILNGIILWTRPRASARKYAAIWSNQGSPLRVHSESLAAALERRLASKGNDAPIVAYAMRYGNPSIDSVLNRIRAAGAERILLVPMYPQYAASTTAAAYDAVGDWLRNTRNVPELRWIRHFHDHPAYIGALSRLVLEHWARHGKPARLLMSFHGLPRYTLDKGDPYHCECHKTARLLAQALGLDATQWQLSFQSRFGRARWLEPYTVATLKAWGAEKIGRIDVVCPGFISDCLETLEEIGIEGRQSYLAAGGAEFHLIPCLNEREDWVQAMEEITSGHIVGWESYSRNSPESTKAAAMALGAKK